MKIEPQMDGLTAVEQASKAIVHTLGVIRQNPAIGYHCGHGTQTYSLLVEARAKLGGKTIDQVADVFPPAQARKLKFGELRACPFCNSSYVESESGDEGAGVYCQECNAVGPRKETMREAHEAWNRRDASSH